MTQSLISEAELREVADFGMRLRPVDILQLERGLAVLGITTGEADLRPGGTVAGPLLFWFADMTMYAMVLSVIGRVPLAVTTDATIHFLRRPVAGRMVAKARLLKEGKRLVVGDVEIMTGAEDEPVAHVVMTYSVPPR